MNLTLRSARPVGITNWGVGRKFKFAAELNYRIHSD